MSFYWCENWDLTVTYSRAIAKLGLDCLLVYLVVLDHVALLTVPALWSHWAKSWILFFFVFMQGSSFSWRRVSQGEYIAYASVIMGLQLSMALLFGSCCWDCHMGNSLIPMSLSFWVMVYMIHKALMRHFDAQEAVILLHAFSQASI